MSDELTAREAMELAGGQLGAVLTTGNCTTGFLFELALHVQKQGYHVGKILDEIAILEGSRPGPSRTKPASQFTKEPLLGLWHKHHFQTGFMHRNVIQELKRTDVITPVFQRHRGEMMTPEIAGEIAHAVVFDGFSGRSGRQAVTGEWIIFRREDGRNHYLTLARHTEGDEVIAARVAEYDEQD